jgi:hypothetical protein
LSDLKKNVRSINYIVVTWAAYRKPNSVTQCERCLQFGHGATNCNMTQKCLKCGERHSTENCIYEKNLQKKPRKSNAGIVCKTTHQTIPTAQIGSIFCNTDSKNDTSAAVYIFFLLFFKFCENKLAGLG